MATRRFRCLWWQCEARSNLIIAMVKRTQILVFLGMLGSLLLSSTAQSQSGEALQLRVVPIPVNSYRLLSMSMDEQGFIWAGSIHRQIHRYDPRTAVLTTIALPYDATASACISVGHKVYILGQSFRQLIIYDQERQSFSAKPYPSPQPEVWYGTESADGRHIYLFDRGTKGVIKWDTEADVGTVIDWPYRVPVPSSGRIEQRDNALWCNVWDFGSGQYKPVGIARLDLKSDTFTGWYPFPADDAELEPYQTPASTFFLPYTLKGKLVPFDFQQQRWCKFLPVPRYGEVFAFMGGPVLHKGRSYYSLSTYNGTDVGCDGQPYHFCNAVLQFDPESRAFEFLTLDAGSDKYYQVAYMLSAGGEFFATGTNIREPDGTLNRDRAGEVVFWQTLQSR
jgi:hypothetical protein